ncbi:MAG: biosynthetic arginine decarboxylase [Candidatus Krumholzibacteriia bacterium]
MLPGAPWNVAKSIQLYGFDYWGAGYFGVNDQGNAIIRPDGPGGPELDLHELVDQARQRDIRLPILFRFNGILRHRLHTLHGAFGAAMAEYDYQGSYRPVYPIKVNQQRHVVSELIRAGRDLHLGLEVGSKPELVAALALHENPDALLICNGYKDRQYLELAMMAQRVGREVIVVIEKPSEIDLLLKISREQDIEPCIGFRLRLAGRGAGRWERSGGERAKFGLNVAEIATALKLLKEHGKQDWVRLVHFHNGSQLTNISSLKQAVREAAQMYVQVSRYSPRLKYFDVGGGLAVDYDGSKTAFESSMNYTVEEYARDVVWILKEACDNAEVAHPTVVTECGRAMVAYASVLVAEVLGLANTFTTAVEAQAVPLQTEETTVLNMAQLLQDLTPKNCQEALHDAVELRQTMLSQFSLGLMSIEDRALGDQCYWALLNAINTATKELHYVPEDLRRLPALLTDTYFCNLSIFQSMPDSWAIDQIFPITPITRLNEEPKRRVVLADITCDSDGKVERFADLRDIKHYLPAHDLKEGERYCFGVFLVGAYQEILGDMHNLFGDTNAVHVDVKPDGRVAFTNVVSGDTVGDVLRYVAFERSDLVERWRHALEAAVTEGRLTARESAVLQRKYDEVFGDYTYLR